MTKGGPHPRIDDDDGPGRQRLVPDHRETGGICARQELDGIVEQPAIKIDYVGGAPAIGSPFTVVQKTAQGVYDLVVCASAYYANVAPEADAYKLMEKPPAETRANGGWQMLVEKLRPLFSN